MSDKLKKLAGKDEVYQEEGEGGFLSFFLLLFFGVLVWEGRHVNPLLEGTLLTMHLTLTLTLTIILSLKQWGGIHAAPNYTTKTPPTNLNCAGPEFEDNGLPSLGHPLPEVDVDPHVVACGLSAALQPRTG